MSKQPDVIYQVVTAWNSFTLPNFATTEKELEQIVLNYWQKYHDVDPDTISVCACLRDLTVLVHGFQLRFPVKYDIFATKRVRTP